MSKKLIILGIFLILLLSIGCDREDNEIQIDIDEPIIDATTELVTDISIQDDLERAWELYNQNKFNDAITEFNKAQEKIPNSYRVYNGLGNSYYRLANHAKTIENFEKAIEFNPEIDDISLIYRKLGWSFYAIGEHEKAKESFNEVISLNSNDAIAYAGKGLSLYQLGQFDEALNALNKSLSLDPTIEHAYTGMGYVYNQKGEYVKAKEMFLKSLEMDPNDTDTQDLLWEVESKIITG